MAASVTQAFSSRAARRRAFRSSLHGPWPLITRLNSTQSIAPTVLAPNLNVRFDEIDNLSWKDIKPKMGATYDLFGNGKTALKFTLNKYLEGMGTTGIGPANVSENPNPINRLVGTTALSRLSWGSRRALSRRRLTFSDRSVAQVLTIRCSR